MIILHRHTKQKHSEFSQQKTPKKTKEVEVWNRIEEGLLDIHVHSDSVFVLFVKDKVVP